MHLGVIEIKQKMVRNWYDRMHHNAPLEGGGHMIELLKVDEHLHTIKMMAMTAFQQKILTQNQIKW